MTKISLSPFPVVYSEFQNSAQKKEESRDQEKPRMPPILGTLGSAQAPSLLVRGPLPAPSKNKVHRDKIYSPKPFILQKTISLSHRQHS